MYKSRIVGGKDLRALVDEAKWLQGKDRTREVVRLRDEHTCQMCKKVWKESTSKRRFDVHHLGGLCGKKSRKYDRLSEIDGLITLCHKCHYNHPEHSRFSKISTVVH